jgi:hypothetical protein
MNTATYGAAIKGVERRPFLFGLEDTQNVFNSCVTAIDINGASARSRTTSSWSTASTPPAPCCCAGSGN